MKRKAPASASRARLAVLATADDRKFRDVIGEMLASKQRLDREAALEALVARPAAELRPLLRELYFELDADPLKRDQGARQRVDIVKVLHSIGDTRDADIGVRSTDAYEHAFGEDISWQLRVHGLMLLARLAPEVFPYYAVEHLDDLGGVDGEPANSAFQMLAAAGHHALIYQWLLTSSGGATNTAAVFELFADAPPEIVHRYARHALAGAIKREDEALCTVLVESIVRLELEASYASIAELLFAKVSDELYSYIAMLLASTNRAPLLSLLEEQLHRGRRPKLIVAALEVRPTPEQEAIVRRWDER
jgi:hypothetical protein